VAQASPASATSGLIRRLSLVITTRRNTAGSNERAAARLAELLVLPGWLLIASVFALPILGAFYLSFRNETLGSFTPPRFIGFANYLAAFGDPRFWESIWVTLVIMILGLLIQLPIGLGLAMLLERPLRGISAIRTALMIPMLLTPVAVGLMWRFMFDTDLGVINWFLEQLGLGTPNWLGRSWPAIFAITIVDSWQTIPFVMLIALAGLAGLPRGPREAAAIDGANALRIFWHVTLPSLTPVLLVIVMIRVIDAFKLFDIIFIVTQRGGPGTATQTLGMLTYNTGFIAFQMSKAAALGVLLVLIVSPIYFLWRRSQRSVS
jgi:multiple sugar transport system permease protein